MTQDEHDAKAWRRFKQAVTNSLGKGSHQDDEVCLMIIRMMTTAEVYVDDEIKETK